MRLPSRLFLVSLLLPASLLGYFSLAYISRMTRSLMLSQLRQEYILTARVKGVSETRIIWKHAMGNIMVPLLTVIALSYGTLLEGSVLTETVFAWHGIGLYITDSIFGQDLPAVMGGTIVVGFVYIIINTLTDDEQTKLLRLKDGARYVGSARDQLASFAAERGWSDETLNDILRKLAHSRS